MASAMEKFAKGFGEAIADIREKVVEEPWYGRAVNDRAIPQWPETKEPEPGGAVGGLTREREAAPDLDMDR